MSEDTILKLKDMHQPRLWKNPDYPGSYSLAHRLSEMIISPGGTLNIEQYITGYGMIDACKIRCYLSSDIFDWDESIVWHSMFTERDAEGQTIIKWGGAFNQIPPLGYTTEVLGLTIEGWKENTAFFDFGNAGSIITEHKLDRAPFEFKLKTKPTIRPGNHYVDFYLTYSNGQEWKTEKTRLDFRVNNFFERHAQKLSVLAFIALCVTITADGIIPFGSFLTTIGQETSKTINAREVTSTADKEKLTLQPRSLYTPLVYPIEKLKKFTPQPIPPAH